MFFFLTSVKQISVQYIGQQLAYSFLYIEFSFDLIVSLKNIKFTFPSNIII